MVEMTWLMRFFCRRGVLAMLMVSMASTACTKSFQGEYTDPDKVEIVDDKWNETDARKTAEVLVASALDKPWLPRFQGTHRERPIVLVDDVENRTDEHIDTQALTDFIRNELINSGKVRFVNEARRKQILEELEYQGSGVVAEESRRQFGRQLGAHFMLGGNVTSYVATQGGRRTVTYQTTLTLTNVETSEIEWSERNQIRKSFRRARANW